MEYSTLQGKLIMPEYGRNVQHMVEYALTIDDKQTRQRCVETIMNTMTNLFPYLKDEAQRHKMYDHLAIMSDFRLDIDYPYERPQPEELKYHPDPIPYSERPVKMRQYGRVVELMIAAAIDEKDEQKKKDLIVRIANRMKRNYLLWNKDHVERDSIVEDLVRLSGGQLSCDFPEFYIAKRKVLLGIKDDSQQQPQKKKNQKKNNR